ncbi:MAG TPA: uroporphyrinogen decarboxylase family protein [Candidatus Brocadiia bacterium]|nr:uroporphyrinogen decarboxylase family protein [Candidatus Brocadiia bacterium]
MTDTFRRARVELALAHHAGATPLDFGATHVTGMHVTCVEDLRRHYSLERRPVKVIDPYQMLGLLEDDLLDAIDVDTVGLFPPTSLFGYRNENWREFRTPWGQLVLVPDGFRVTPSEGGGLLIYPKGDLTAPPSGHMPAGGYFFDSIIRQEPIREEALDPKDNLEEFGPASQEDVDYFGREAKRLAATGRAVVASFGGMGLGDIALVPAPFLARPKGIRDVAEWYMSTVTRQDYVHKVFSKQVEIAVGNLARFHEAVGGAVSVVFTCGTDFGTQTSSFCSPRTFDALYAPYYRRVNDWIHRHTAWKIMKHSCGAVEPFLSRFADAGFDIINPVQCSAAGMDPVALKERYGDRLVFWGGGVDTQKTLPFGRPAQVRDEALRRCEIFSKNGGFVFNAIHNVQAGTPVENIVAMLEAVAAFRGRG